ncbi:hypothetical protein F5B21DRAFT_298748 [Xylaria acuta]|nr:hypothetical protein F5B21DRAFT_298748 [Xylaria acuta]
MARGLAGLWGNVMMYRYLPSFFPFSLFVSPRPESKLLYNQAESKKLVLPLAIVFQLSTVAAILSLYHSCPRLLKSTAARQRNTEHLSQATQLRPSHPIPSYPIGYHHGCSGAPASR